MSFEFIERLVARFKKLLRDRRGEYIPQNSDNTASTRYTIAGVTYFVKAFFRKDTSLTVVDKVARLVDKDAGKCLDAEMDSE